MNEYFALFSSYDKQFLHNLAVSTAINNFENMFLMYIVKCPWYLFLVFFCLLSLSLSVVVVFLYLCLHSGCFDIFSIFNWHMYLQISRDWHNKLIWFGEGALAAERDRDRTRADNNTNRFGCLVSSLYSHFERKSSEICRVCKFRERSHRKIHKYLNCKLLLI